MPKDQLTIASNHQKFVIVGDIVDSNIWVSSDDLLLWCKLSTFLELEVANSSRQSQIAINAPEINKPSSRRNPSFLACTMINPGISIPQEADHTFILGLMIERQRLRSPFNT